MVGLADVCRRFAHAHVARHGARMLPSQRRALEDITTCRTAAQGGHLWRCEACSAEVYAYHSCRNRSCPRCHRKQTERWLAAREAEMLDAPYFHLTIIACPRAGEAGPGGARRAARRPARQPA